MTDTQPLIWQEKVGGGGGEAREEGKPPSEGGVLLVLHADSPGEAK